MSVDQSRMTPDQNLILTRMRRWCADGAQWTSDLAHGAGISTPATRRALVGLEKRGLVRRVVRGNPTSWELVTHD